MKQNEKKEGAGSAKQSDWQVVVTKDLQVVDAKEMSIVMSRTRLKPVFTSASELIIVVPAESKEKAGEKALRIARKIESSGLWGLDFLKFEDLGPESD